MGTLQPSRGRGVGRAGRPGSDPAQARSDPIIPGSERARALCKRLASGLQTCSGPLIPHHTRVGEGPSTFAKGLQAACKRARAHSYPTIPGSERAPRYWKYWLGLPVLPVPWRPSLTPRYPGRRGPEHVCKRLASGLQTCPGPLLPHHTGVGEGPSTLAIVPRSERSIQQRIASSLVSILSVSSFSNESCCPANEFRMIKGRLSHEERKETLNFKFAEPNRIPAMRTRCR